MEGRPLSRTLAVRPKPTTTATLSFTKNSQAPSTAATHLRVYSKRTTGDLEVPETECWEKYPNQPLTHALLCGHEHNTPIPQPCNAVCKTTKIAETKAEGDRFKCQKGDCGGAPKRKSNVNIFIPKKPIKKKLPVSVMQPGAVKAIVSKDDDVVVAENKDLSSLEGAGTGSKQVVELGDATTKAGKWSQEADDDEDEAELNRLNAECEADPALAALIASQTGTGMRRLSKLHAGYALKAERDAEDELAALQNGVAKLQSVSNARRAADSPTFTLPDRPAEETANDLVAQALLPLQTYLARTRLQQRRALGIKSVETKQPTHVVVDNETEDNSHNETEAVGGRGLRLDGTYLEDKNICAECEKSSNEHVDQCKGCERFFHPSCIGVAAGGRCSECRERRAANQGLVKKIFNGNAAPTKPSSIAEMRAANLARRNARKEEMERESFKTAIAERIRRRKADADCVVDQGTADEDIMDVE